MQHNFTGYLSPAIGKRLSVRNRQNRYGYTPCAGRTAGAKLVFCEGLQAGRGVCRCLDRRTAVGAGGTLAHPLSLGAWRVEQVFDGSTARLQWRNAAAEKRPRNPRARE